MSGGSTNREATLSIRLAWPFVRVASAPGRKRLLADEDMELLAGEGIGLAEFADPDTRVRHRTAMEILARSVRRIGDPSLGLKAGVNMEAADLGVLDHVARTCANLREAIRCGARYAELMNEASRVTLEEGTDIAIWRWEVTDLVPQPPASNDFVVSSVLSSWRRYTRRDIRPVEVHVTHREPTSPTDYERIFGCPVRVGMPHNAILFGRAHLDAPMVCASRGLHLAFDEHARSLHARLVRNDSVAGRAREMMLAELDGGNPSMEAIARKMAMSVATLRRRLEDEGTSHRQLLDSIRRELATRYLLDRDLAISEVAFLLGFSHVTAFYKAFKRWMDGVTPAEFRAGARHQAGPVPPGRSLAGPMSPQLSPSMSSSRNLR